jgi:hypothetical protein
MRSCIKKTLIVPVLLCIGIIALTAQTTEGTTTPGRWFFGVEAAYAHNTLYTETGYRPFSQYVSEHGFSVGVPVRFVIFDWLAVQSGVEFIQKNYSQIRTDNDKIYTNYTNSFVEFPLLAQVSTKIGTERLRLFASAGVELGVWVLQQRKGSIPTLAEPGFGDDRDKTDLAYQSFDETVTWNDTKDNRFDAALIAGLGIAYNLKTCTVYIEGRYLYGLTDLEKSYQRNQAPRINDTITVGAGILFNLDIFTGLGRTR